MGWLFDQQSHLPLNESASLSRGGNNSKTTASSLQFIVISLSKGYKPMLVRRGFLRKFVFHGKCEKCQTSTSTCCVSCAYLIQWVGELLWEWIEDEIQVKGIMHCYLEYSCSGTGMILSGSLSCIKRWECYASTAYYGVFLQSSMVPITTLTKYIKCQPLSCSFYLQRSLTDNHGKMQSFPWLSMAFETHPGPLMDQSSHWMNSWDSSL